MHCRIWLVLWLVGWIFGSFACARYGWGFHKLAWEGGWSSKHWGYILGDSIECIMYYYGMTDAFNLYNFFGLSKNMQWPIIIIKLKVLFFIYDLLYIDLVNLVFDTFCHLNRKSNCFLFSLFLIFLWYHIAMLI